MIELSGNIWDHHNAGRWIVITTNGDIRKDGACVMGRGVAKQAADRYPNLSYELGRKLGESGNQVYVFEKYRIITFPVKDHWRDKADLDLIKKSLQQIVAWADTPRKHGLFHMVRPGCYNGGRDWEREVKPLCQRYLDDRFAVVEWT